jgi:predicted RNA-binding protein with PUA-like domain
MKYWLLKSEPGSFSIDDLKKSPRKTTCWDGVRNYQARNFLRDNLKMRDLALFYHSNCAQTGIAGIVEIVREAYPDDTAFDPRNAHYDPTSDKLAPRWFMIDVRLKRKLKRVVLLSELKQHKDSTLFDFALLQRGNRLSVLPVTENQWQFILSLE